MILMHFFRKRTFLFIDSHSGALTDGKTLVSFSSELKCCVSGVVVFVPKICTLSTLLLGAEVFSSGLSILNWDERRQ